MFIIENKKIWFTLSTTLVLMSALSLFIWGLNLGIDFRGGTLIEYEFSKIRPSAAEIINLLKNFNLGDFSVQETGNSGIILRLKNIDQEKRVNIFSALSSLTTSKDKDNDAHEIRFEEIGPSIGNELKVRAFYAIFFAIVSILIFITFAFRKVSYTVSSFKYSLAAIIALCHDVLIVLGLFSVLGRFWGVEVGLPFVAAILTVFGYSVNDTIVIFDRIRENALKEKNRPFKEIIGKSISETIIRSVMTSATVILALGSIYIFGGDSIKYFSLALIVGIFVGTYSSLFLASPILAFFAKR